MPVDHQAMREEIDRLRQFFLARRDDPYLDHVVYAFEDLPERARDQARMIMEVPPGGSLAKKVIEVTTNAAADLYGSLEKVKLLHFLSHYPVKPYTYRIDDRLFRGSRPSQAKLATLVRDSYTATINLCAEMEGGDGPRIRKAGLTASLKDHWIPITDMTRPATADVTKFLGLLTEPRAGRFYLHCEAGKSRTGVMTACYRMAVMGWSPWGRPARSRELRLLCPRPDFVHPALRRETGTARPRACPLSGQASWFPHLDSVRTERHDRHGRGITVRPGQARRLTRPGYCNQPAPGSRACNRRYL